VRDSVWSWVRELVCAEKWGVNVQVRRVLVLRYVQI
jgi:hypothetical protein